MSYETIRRWCLKFGPGYARKLKRREGRVGDHWHLDEVFIRINGQQQYLWRAVDQDGDVIDILVQASAPGTQDFLYARTIVSVPEMKARDTGVHY